MATFPCPHCGQPVEAEHIYCPHCTRSLRLNAQEPAIVADLHRTSSTRVLGWAVGFILFGVAFVFALPLLLTPPGPKTRCLSNIKQLATGTLMYAADNDERLMLGPDVRVPLMPYLKDLSVFECADTHMPFSVNDKVLGVETVAVTDPNKTVVFYEGMLERLEYRHQGAANVAYLDGHARGVKPSDPISFDVKLVPPSKVP